MIKKIFRKRK